MCSPNKPPQSPPMQLSKHFEIIGRCSTTIMATCLSSSIFFLILKENSGAYASSGLDLCRDCMPRRRWTRRSWTLNRRTLVKSQPAIPVPGPALCNCLPPPLVALVLYIHTNTHTHTHTHTHTKPPPQSGCCALHTHTHTQEPARSERAAPLQQP
jgi:ABC-type nickel/cobalt efflux system permease component RcnA